MMKQGRPKRSLYRITGMTIDVGLLREVDRLAKEETRSRSSQLAVLVREALDARKRGE